VFGLALAHILNTSHADATNIFCELKECLTSPNTNTNTLIDYVFIYLVIYNRKRTKGSVMRQVNLLSTALSDITNVDSPDSPSGVIGVYFATM
jgi:hypothetical protein